MGERKTGSIAQVTGLGPGDHVCWAFTSDDEHRDAGDVYLTGGVFDPDARIANYVSMVRQTPATAFHLHGGADGAIRLVGEVDFAYADRISEILASSVRDAGEPVLDVWSLRFADAAGLRAIVATVRELATFHEQVRITGATSTFRNLWRVLRLDDQLPTAVVD